MTRDGADALLDRDEPRRFAEAHPDAIVAFVGPTASGKSELAIELAEAVGGEIVSVDSVQVYRYFELGTGKPSEAERARAPHHLVDVVEPNEPMDAKRFADLADAAIAGIRARGRRPILAGGTYLWMKAILGGLAAAPRASDAQREELRETASDVLYERLVAVDPKSAARLHPNDRVRVVRALEVHAATGRSLSDLHAAHRFQTRRYDARLFAVAREKDELRARITARIDAWLDAGWVAEVEALGERGFGEARAMSAVGFRQIAMQRRGEIPPTREELQTAIVRATALFARRQRTWLGREPVTWLAP